MASHYTRGYTVVYFFYCIFLQKLKNGTCVKKIIRRGHSMPAPLSLPLQALVAAIKELKATAVTIFCNCKKSNDRNPPFLPVGPNSEKKKKQTEDMSLTFTAVYVYHKFT